VIADAEGKGAKIRLGEEVVSVKDKVGEVEAVSVKTDRGVYTARTVLSTIPLGVLQAAPADLFQPALPDCLVSTITRTVVGTLEKVVLSYEVVWWPNPEAASYTLLPVSDTPPTQDSPVDAVLAASTLTVANFAAPTLPGATSTLVTYLSHTPATALAGRPASEIAAGLHAYIATRLGVSAPPKATDIAVTAWRADPLARGATSTPSAISTDGSRSPMDFKELGRPLWEGRLGFAGEHTDMEHRGSVAGAVVSGQREAARIERWLAKHEQ
jgi:lysine-specific histone demethylase 1B